MTAERFVAGMTADSRSINNRVSFVMAGLVPAIHVFGAAKPQVVDARDKRGHDGGEVRPEHDGREAVRFNSSWPGIKPFVMAGLVPLFCGSRASPTSGCHPRLLVLQGC
jgi:hypothetical protein